MASGHKTGGRQKGTPNKRKAEYDAKFAEAVGRATAALSPSEIASMMPVDVLLFAMRREVLLVAGFQGRPARWNVNGPSKMRSRNVDAAIQ
jgi:hypothetical protein